MAALTQDWTEIDLALPKQASCVPPACMQAHISGPSIRTSTVLDRLILFKRMCPGKAKQRKHRDAAQPQGSRTGNVLHRRYAAMHRILNQLRSNNSSSLNE